MSRDETTSGRNASLAADAADLNPWALMCDEMHDDKNAGVSENQTHHKSIKTHSFVSTTRRKKERSSIIVEVKVPTEATKREKMRSTS